VRYRAPQLLVSITSVETETLILPNVGLGLILLELMCV